MKVFFTQPNRRLLQNIKYLLKAKPEKSVGLNGDAVLSHDCWRYVDMRSIQIPHLVSINMLIRKE